ncbi:MAG TPA: flagellar export protein FliJ [Burkholderiales bacterium]|nr:flagellar export protein FliJ [Burkholderiales bacterium]
MTTVHPLETLQGLAEDATTEAMTKLAEMLGRLRDSEARLVMLMRYRDEYRTKLDSSSRNGVSVIELANFRTFLSRLEEAVAQQQADVNHWQQAVERSRENWREAERKSRSFGVLNDRRNERERSTAARSEQKQNDEFAARMANTPRWS